MIRDRGRRHLLQVELQAAREHRHRDLLGIGRREDELDVLGRLLQRLQHSVERRSGKHVDFVDHVNLEAPAGRRVHRVLQKLPHLVHLGVGCGIDFDQVDEAAGIDLHAGRALPARAGADAGLAVQRLGEDAGERGLSHPTGSREQVGVMQALFVQRVAQRSDDVLLPDQRLERARTPLAGEDLVRHEGILAAGAKAGLRIERASQGARFAITVASSRILSGLPPQRIDA